MTRFFRVYKFVLWAALLIIALPLLAGAVYNRPSGDDMAHLWEVRAMSDPQLATFDMPDRQIERAVSNPAALLVQWWKLYSGTFSDVLLFYCVWSLFGPGWSCILPMLAVVLYVVSSFQAVRCLRAFQPKMTKDVSTCLSLLLAIMFLLLMPDETNSLYWFAGATYSITAALVICAFSTLVRRCWCVRSASRARQWLDVGFFCLAFFLIGGGDSINSTMSVLLYGFFLLCVLWKHQPKKYLLPFVFLLAGYALATLAPGNFARLDLHMGRGLSLPLSLATSFVKALQFAFSDIRYWIYPVLCLPVLLEAAKHFAPTFKACVLISLGSVSLLAAGFFPLLLTVGDVYITDRHYCVLFFYLSELVFANLLAWLSYLGRQRDGALSQQIGWRPKRIAAGLAATALLLGLLSVPHLTLSPFNLNSDLAFMRVTSHLRAGTLQEYAEQYDEIVAQIRAHPDETVAVRWPTQNDVFNCIRPSTDSLENLYFSQYYGGTFARMYAGE